MVAEKIKIGDTIAIFSPSSPATVFAKNRYKKAKKFLEQKGFNVLEGKLTGKSDFYRSGSILERAEEFNELIKNEDVKCIMSTIGGMNSNSILHYIDYDAVMKNPKIIIGYSDVTAILLAIYQKTGLITYYGPACVASFGEVSPFVDDTYNYFKQLLIDDVDYPCEIINPKYWTDEYIDWNNEYEKKKKNDNKVFTINKGVVEGRLIAGNLNTMYGIWGSEYMPEIKKGDILMIEDSLKNAAEIERSFSMLKLNGVFDRIGGLVLGKHEKFDDLGTNRRPYEILLEVLGEYNFPFIAEYDCSHTHPMITLPIGALVRLDATNKIITIIEE